MNGKVALVTEGSSCIGFVLGKALPLVGATIIFNGQSQIKIDKAIEAHKNIGITTHGYVCNVTDEDNVIEMVEKINNEIGVIDILVNNFAIIKRIPMIEMSASNFRDVIDVDLCDPFIVSKVVIPYMIENGGVKLQIFAPL